MQIEMMHKPGSDEMAGDGLGVRLLQRHACGMASVIERDRTWTYEEFVSHATDVAAYLRRNRIERILNHLPQGYFAYVLTWGAFLSGTTFCNVGHDTPASRLERYIETFQPDLVISDGGHTGCEPPYAFLARIAGLASEGAGQSLIDALVPVDPEATAYVLFTSGSTGQPKGVMIARQSLENAIFFALREYQVAETDVWAQYSSIGFDLSLLDIFTAIAGGAALVPIATKGEKLMPARLIARYGVTVWHSVPSAFEIIDHSGQLTTATLAHLRLAIFCGERLFPTLVEKIFAARDDMLIYNTYGPTEATIFCTYQRLTSRAFQHLAGGTISIGANLPGTEIALEVAEDGIGELIVRGISVGKGYIASDHQGGYVIEKGSTTPVAYKTGDFCRQDDGALYFVCRRDRQVKISGNRVDLSEIDLLLREEGCEAAVSIFDGWSIRSFVLGQSVTDHELRAALTRQLPSYYLPAMIHILQAFPYTQSGKVDTDALLKWERDNGHA